MRGLTLTVLLVAALHVATARELLGSAIASRTVTCVLFEDNDLGDDHQTFKGTIPLPTPGTPAKAPGTTCSPCIELNYISTNSWESFICDAGYSITFFDSHGCSGNSITRPDRTRDTAQIQATMSGDITGRLEDSADSIRICI